MAVAMNVLELQGPGPLAMRATSVTPPVIAPARKELALNK